MDKGLKQRIVGALVLVALAVIFVPMLFSRPDEVREVVVDAPPMPATPAMPSVELQPVVVPEPEPLPPDPTLQVPEAQTGAEVAAPAAQPAVEPPPAIAPVPAAAVAEAPASRLDANSLPVSWSVQLASLSSRSSAEALQQSLRSKGYNAYVRTFEGMNRVFVGPVLERAEADRLRDQIKRQQKLEGFVVRFQPETR
jgi:DedD protein